MEPADVRRRISARRRLPAPSERRSIRVAAGLSQEEVAALVGVHRESVSRWELGQRSPRGEMLVAYVEVLDELAKGAAA